MTVRFCLLLAGLTLVFLGTGEAGPPLVTPGKCQEDFVKVPAKELMRSWYVVRHTDNIEPFDQDCVVMSFDTRRKYKAEMRVDVKFQKMDEDMMPQDTGTVIGDVDVESNKPLGVSFKADMKFPNNFMILEHDKENNCMAIWGCTNSGANSMKGAWIVCSSRHVSPEAIDRLEDDIVRVSHLGKEDFKTTEYMDC